MFANSGLTARYVRVVQAQGGGGGGVGGRWGGKQGTEVRSLAPDPQSRPPASVQHCALTKDIQRCALSGSDTSH